MRSRPVTTSRRTALGVVAGLAGLATACTPDRESDPGTTPSASVSPVDADQELVTETAVLLATAQVFVEALGRDVPSLKNDLRPLRRLHAAHLEILGGFDDSIPSPPPSSGRPADALAELLRSEQSLQRRLARAAVEAESGSLAKLLASMAAAVAQHLAVLR